MKRMFRMVRLLKRLNSTRKVKHFALWDYKAAQQLTYNIFPPTAPFEEGDMQVP